MPYQEAEMQQDAAVLELRCPSDIMPFLKQAIQSFTVGRCAG